MTLAVGAGGDWGVSGETDVMLFYCLMFAENLLEVIPLMRQTVLKIACVTATKEYKQSIKKSFLEWSEMMSQLLVDWGSTGILSTLPPPQPDTHVSLLGTIVIQFKVLDG